MMNNNRNFLQGNPSQQQQAMFPGSGMMMGGGGGFPQQQQQMGFMGAYNNNNVQLQQQYQNQMFGAPQQQAYNSSTFGQMPINSAPPAQPPVPQGAAQPPPPPGTPPPQTSDENEQQKISMLQTQAKMWQEQKRIAEQQEAMRKKQEQEFIKQAAEKDPEVALCLEEETQFQEQYETWKKQFKEWKEENKDHPDREQYAQYEQQWKTYEQQMDAQKTELASRRDSVLASYRARMSNVTKGPGASGNVGRRETGHVVSSSGPRGQQPNNQMLSPQARGSQATLNASWSQAQNTDVQSQEAQSIGRQHHPPPHQQQYQQQQGNLRQSRPNVPERMPNMSQQQMNVQQQHPNMGQKHPGMRQMNPHENQHSNVLQQQSNMGQHRPNMNQQRPNIGQQQSNRTQQQSNIGQQRPGMSQQRPNMGQQSPSMGRHPNMGQQRPNMGQQGPSMGQQRPSMGQQQPNMGQQRPDVGQQLNVRPQQPNVRQQQPNVRQQQPNVRQQQPNVRQQQPNVRQQQPNVRQQQPNVRQQQPNVRQQKPEMRQQQPNLRQQNLNVRQQRPNVHQQRPNLGQHSDIRHQHPNVRQQENRPNYPRNQQVEYPDEDYYIDNGEDYDGYSQYEARNQHYGRPEERFYEDTFAQEECFDQSEKQRLTNQQPVHSNAEPGKGDVKSLMSVDAKPTIASNVNDSTKLEPNAKGAAAGQAQANPKPTVATGSLAQAGEPVDKYDEQKKLIAQLMGSSGSTEENDPAVFKADASMIPEHKAKKPALDGMSTDTLQKSTLSVVLSTFDGQEKAEPVANMSSSDKEMPKDQVGKGNEKQAETAQESDVVKSSAPLLTGSSNAPISSAVETAQSANTGSQTATAAGAPGVGPGTPVLRPNVPGQGPGVAGQRPWVPSQRPDGSRPRFVQPNQRPGAPGQPSQRQRFEGTRHWGPRGFDENAGHRYPAPRQRGPTATSSYQQPSPHLIADAAKSLSSHEHDMLRKATEGLRMQGIPRHPGQGGEQAPQLEQEQEEEYHRPPPHRAHPDGPYPGEPIGEHVPRRRNLLTMVDGYEPHDRPAMDRPPMRRRPLGDPYERDFYGRDRYDDYRPPPPRRFDDPFERFEAYRPEVRLRRERDGWGEPYYDDDLPPFRPRARGLLMDDPYAPRADDPYDDPYLRPMPRHDPYGPEREMMRRGLHRDLPREPFLRTRDPYGRDPVHRDHLMREHIRDPLLRDADRDSMLRNVGADPSAASRAAAAAALNPEVIDYSHRQPPLHLPDRGLDERSRVLANVNRGDSPPPGFKDRSPIRLAQSSPTLRPQVADLFDAYSTLSVPQVTDIRDLICKPKRDNRPPHICLIVRGAPGAGKTHCSKLIRDKEAANGGSAPRILNLDDYFMVEVERLITDEDTGRKMKRKMLEYEYEPEMEESYRADFFKSFKKTVDKGFFSFIIIDAVNDKVRHFEEFAKFARSKSFQVYVVEVKADSQTCFSRNIHNRSLKDIEKIIAEWEETPSYFNKVDMRGLLQDNAIDDIEMEDKKTDDSSSSGSSSSDDDDDLIQVAKRSKWDMDADDHKLDKLDGLLHKKPDTMRNMEDFLTLPDDYESKARGDDGKKHVRWADLEEKRLQDRDREIGFVVGQTNWNRMLDDNYADKQMNQTKYI